MHLLREIALVFHFIGLGMVAVGILAGPILSRVLWKKIENSISEAKTAGEIFGRLGMLPTFGGLVLLVSGFLILWAEQWARFGQTWLTAKLVIYVAMTLGGFLVAKPIGPRVMKLIASAASAGSLDRDEASRLRRRMTGFEIIQTILFLSAISLAVFKP